MSKSSLWPNEFDEKHQEILDELLIDQNQFRDSANDYIEESSNKLKKSINKLSRKDEDRENFLIKWKYEFLPKIKRLENLHKDEAFVGVLEDKLMIAKLSLAEKLSQIIEERKEEIKKEFLNNLFPIDTKNKRDIYIHKRDHAEILLKLSNQELSQIYNYYFISKIYLIIARKNGIAIIEPNAKLFKRRKQRKEIIRQKIQLTKYKDERIKFINQRLQILSSCFDGLLINLYKYEIDLVSIFDLRQQYEKKINNLTKANKNKPDKYIDLFKSITNNYINSKTETLISAKEIKLTSLDSNRENLKKILMNVFDLSNKDKNLSLLYYKEYRELIEEKKNLNIL